MPVAVGEPAPDFTLYSDTQSPFTLSQFAGEKPVLLLFFPGAFTTVCSAELATVNSEFESFGADFVEIVGISTDSPFVLREYRRVNKFQFPLLSDHDGEVSARYGAKFDRDYTFMELDRIAKRAVFLVDRQGIIRYAEVLDNSDKLPDFDEVRKVIQRML